MRAGTRPGSRRWVLAGAVLGAVALAGCGDGGGGGGGGTGPSEEVLGTPITGAHAVADYAALAWSPDGAELYYAAGDSTFPTLSAWRLSDRTERVIDSRRLSRGGFRFANKGSWICEWIGQTASGGATGWAYGADCLERGGGAVHTLAPLRPQPDEGFYRLALAASADTLAAFAVEGQAVVALGSSSADSLFLYSTRNPTATYLTIGAPLAFSPDGTRLLYEERPCDWKANLNTCPTRIRDLATSAAQSVWTGGVEDIVYGVEWVGTTPVQIALARAATDTLVVRDMVQHTSRTVFVRTDPAVVPTAYAGAGTLSGDGRLLAVWYEDIRTGIQTLRVHSLTGGPTKEIAVAWHGPAGTPALSPDGRRIAYLVGGQIYLTEIP